MLGRAIKALGWPRDGYCVSSKALYGAADNHAPGGGPRPTQQGLSRKHLVEACEQALRRFGLDYLDLYLCHRPDPDMSIPEIAWTMHTLVQQGKILYWGTSEWPAADIETLCAFAERHDLVPPQLEQPQYSLFHRERVEHEYRPLVERRGLGLTTWSPLASGVLAGRYDEGVPADSRLAAEGFGWLKDFVYADRQEAMQAAARACATWPMSWGHARAAGDCVGVAQSGREHGAAGRVRRGAAAREPGRAGSAAQAGRGGGGADRSGGGRRCAARLTPALAFPTISVLEAGPPRLPCT